MKRVCYFYIYFILVFIVGSFCVGIHKSAHTGSIIIIDILDIFERITKGALQVRYATSSSDLGTISLP